MLCMPAGKGANAASAGTSAGVAAVQQADDPSDDDFEIAGETNAAMAQRHCRARAAKAPSRIAKRKRLAAEEPLSLLAGPSGSQARPPVAGAAPQLSLARMGFMVC